MRPRLLDLFCGSGGVAMGYSRAGFDVFGVDNDLKPLRRYPFPHVCADALEYLAEHWQEYDTIHASPPCQGYSIMLNLPWLRDREYPLLILPTMKILEHIGKPYVLENVMGARYGSKVLAKRRLEAHGLKAHYLCGAMFQRPFYRHRLFATNWLWLAPEHPKHVQIIGGQKANQSRRGETFAFSPAEDARGIESWSNRREYNKGLSGVLSLTPPGNLANWQDGAQANGVGIDHAKGWRLAAEMMGIDWMDRDGLTQAIPPVYTEHIGRQLMDLLAKA